MGPVGAANPASIGYGVRLVVPHELFIKRCLAQDRHRLMLLPRLGFETVNAKGGREVE